MLMWVMKTSFHSLCFILIVLWDLTESKRKPSRYKSLIICLQNTLLLSAKRGLSAYQRIVVSLILRRMSDSQNLRFHTVVVVEWQRGRSYLTWACGKQMPWRKKGKFGMLQSCQVTISETLMDNNWSVKYVGFNSHFLCKKYQYFVPMLWLIPHGSTVCMH